ncbi:PRC-barrel domain-containing protein [Paenibacillus sp. CMAA1364]
MKLHEMIGLPVFDIEAGKKIGKVHDFIIGNGWRILGLELERKALFSNSQLTIDWDHIIAYGEDAIMIRNQQVIRKIKVQNIPYTYALGKNKLHDVPVLTEDGLLLGRISDVYFDQQMGNTIIGLEISDGFVTDIIEGRKWLPCTSNMIIGEHSVIVPAMSEECLDNAIQSVNG